MNDIDLVTAIGRLLHSHRLRQQFRSAPRDVASTIGLRDEDVGLLETIDIDGLDRQAETLLNKRWHEVANLIPQTREMLGDEARDLFRFYASQNWPDGHRRHYVDAWNFLKFLQQNNYRGICSDELNRVRQFAARGYLRTTK